MPYITGFLGLMPLDQSIIFEAGGRMLQGKVPFRDFFLPYGLAPSLIQSVFFRIAGINWFAYVTQASVVNGIFSVVILDCLLMLLPGVKARRLLVGTLLAAWAFYPMTGTPFLENHSFFFAVLAYWCALAGLRRGKYFLLFFCFPLMVPGFYSKPIPVIFWLFPILLECWFHRRGFARYLFPLAAGGVTAAFLLILPALIFPAEAFYYYSIKLPFLLGRVRFEDTFISRLIFSLKYFKLFLVTCIPFAFILTQEKERLKEQAPLLLRCVLIIFITLVFGVITNNNFYNLTSPVFIFTFTICDALLMQQQRKGMVKFYQKFHLLLWLVLLAGITVLNFRRTTDINFRLSDLRNYSKELGIFVKTPLNTYSGNDIEKLKSVITRNEVLYTGDLQFLFALSGRNNPLPLTHINDGTTYNSRDSVHYTRLRQQLVNNLLKNKTTLLIEDESIYNPRQPMSRSISVIRGTKLDSFGSIKIYRIDSVKLGQLARSLNIKRDK